MLLISEDLSTASVLMEALRPLGCEVTLRQGISSGLRAMKDNTVVLMDLPDALASLREMKSCHPDALVIVLAEKDLRAGAVEAGAYFCLEKPLNTLELTAALKNALNYVSIRDELERLRKRESPLPVLGSGAKMQRVLKQIKKASERDVPVLISGERGTGRALVAKAIHQGSARRDGPFVILEAASGISEAQLPEDGAGTGGFARAEGGTLFIKELEGLSPPMRKRLTGFLEGMKPGRGGIRGKAKADVRVICSANGVFEDNPLISGFGSVLRLPPLRERTGDILPLAEHFLDEAARALDGGGKKLSKEAGTALRKHPWPGNLTEMKSTLTMACILSQGSSVESRHLSGAGSSAYCSVKDFLEAKLGRYLKEADKLRNSALHETVISEVEKSLIELVLAGTGGNQVKTAAALGITRTTLRSKIKTYKIALR